MLVAQLKRNQDREIEPLTSSLASVVRWRYGDYAAFLSRELQMLGTEHGVTDLPLGNLPRTGAYANLAN